MTQVTGSNSKSISSFLKTFHADFHSNDGSYIPANSVNKYLSLTPKNTQSMFFHIIWFLLITLVMYWVCNVDYHNKFHLMTDN